jgi:hypothetical protein
MPLPYANLSIKDGALGIVPGSDNGTVALVGTCSSGTANTVYAFTDVQTLKDTLGTGPLVEAAAYVLALAGGTVICCKSAASTAAASGAVTKTGTGLSVVTTAGSSPLDSYQVRVLIVQGGTNPAAGTATFKLSIDGGRTYGPEIAVPTGGTYTGAQSAYGVTIVFSAASLVAGDVYDWTTTAPAYTTGDLGTAIDALLGDSREWFLLYAVGVPADSTATQGVHALLVSKLTTAAAAYRYARGAMQVLDDTDANIATAVASLSDSRIMLCGGFANLLSQTTGSTTKRPAASAIVARAASVPPSEDLGRVATGAVKGIVSLVRDEAKTPALDTIQLATLRTHVGLSGFYVTNGNVKAGATSDFKFLQYGRVMDIASKAVRLGMLRFLNDSVRVNSTTGLILEQDALTIERFIERALRDAVTVPGYASDCSVVVDRSVNILSTQQLKLKFRVVPLGYAKFIDGEIGFSNPALTPV